MLKKSLEKQDTNSGIKNGEKALENVKKSNNYLKKQNVIQLEMPLLIKNVRSYLKKGRNCNSSKQIDVEKMLDMLKNIEKGINDVKNSEIGQQAVQEGNKLWDSLMKKVDDFQKKSK